MEYCLMVNDDDGIHSRKRNRLRCCTITTFLIIPYACVAVLFALYGMEIRNKSDSSEMHSSSVGLSLGAGLKSNGLQLSTLTKGKVVSLTKDGKVQIGGGSTIYKDVLAIHASCPKYLDMDLVYDSIFLMFYWNKGTSTSMFSAVKVNSDSTASIISTATSKTFFNEMSTLDKSNGIFVGIGQHFTQADTNAAVVAGKVNAEGSSIVFGKAADFTPGQTSGPRITRLSNTVFAASFYTAYDPNADSMMDTYYGVVDPITLEITSSPSIHYQNNTNYDGHYALIGMTEKTYVVVNYDDGKPLTAAVVTIPYDGTPASIKKPTTGLRATYKGSLASYDVALARLQANSLVIVYADKSQYNLVKCVIAYVNADKTVSFGSSIAATSGTGLVPYQTYGYMDLDVEVYSSPTDVSDEFVVYFSDASAGGKMAAAVFSVNVAGDIVKESTDYVLSDPNPNFNKYYSWGGLGANSNGQMVIVSSRTDYNCSSFAKTSFSVLDSRPRSIGVTTLESQTSDGISLTSSGLVSGFSGLTPGMVYYSNTRGDLVDCGVYYGSEPALDKGSDYLTSKDGTMIISADSAVGFATSTDTLYVLK